MAFGTSTDPYQPAEKTWRIARSVLEVLAEHDHPVSIVTTSALVVRDLDLPSALAAKVSVSITTLDPALARAMEPRAAARQRRLEGMQEVAAAAAGASSAGWLPVRLPHEVRDLFEEWVQGRHTMRGGKLDDPRFGSRMRGSGPFAELLRKRFEVACRRLGISTTSAPLETRLFRVPGGTRRLFV